MATVEEPILSRLQRLDHILKQIEEIRGGIHSPKSSHASTPSTGTATSDGHSLFLDFSPKSLEKYCRPVNDVMLEVEHKGTLLDRLVQVEERVLKLCLQLEEELETVKNKQEAATAASAEKNSPNSPKKSLKQLVKSCVKPKPNKLKNKDQV